MLPGMYKNVEKTGGFAPVLAYKSSKTLFFSQKYFTRCTPETFLEDPFKVSEVIYAHSRPD
jgi:hypothetical protein